MFRSFTSLRSRLDKRGYLAIGKMKIHVGVAALMLVLATLGFAVGEWWYGVFWLGALALAIFLEWVITSWKPFPLIQFNKYELSVGEARMSSGGLVLILLLALGAFISELWLVGGLWLLGIPMALARNKVMQGKRQQK